MKRSRHHLLRRFVMIVGAAALCGAAVWFAVVRQNSDVIREERIPIAPSPVGEDVEGVDTSEGMPAPAASPSAIGRPVADQSRIAAAVAAVADMTPTAWGEHPAGVVTRLITTTKSIALTLDACGGDVADAAGNGYDADLIATLRREQVPATLFVNSRWIAAHSQEFADLAADPLFEIENHGTAHVPCSVTGQVAYGIAGTVDATAAAHEMDDNAQTIARLTGRTPRYFRPGTAYTDDVCVAIAKELGYAIAGYSLLGDAGATYTAAQVTAALTAADVGDIALLHMNRPAGGTAEGIAAAIPLLREKGFSFVRLSDTGTR